MFFAKRKVLTLRNVMLCYIMVENMHKLHICSKTGCFYVPRGILKQ